MQSCSRRHAAVCSYIYTCLQQKINYLPSVATCRAINCCSKPNGLSVLIITVFGFCGLCSMLFTSASRFGAQASTKAVPCWWSGFSNSNFTSWRFNGGLSWVSSWRSSPPSVRSLCLNLERLMRQDLFQSKYWGALRFSQNWQVICCQAYQFLSWCSWTDHDAIAAKRRISEAKCSL